MKYLKKLLILGFHSINLILIIFYLYPGSIFGCYLYNDCYRELQITRDFTISSNYLISSNHLYVFIILSTLGIFAYSSSNKFKLLINQLRFSCNLHSTFYRTVNFGALNPTNLIICVSNSSTSNGMHGSKSSYKTARINVELNMYVACIPNCVGSANAGPCV